MKFKVILFFSLMCVHLEVLQSGPIFSLLATYYDRSSDLEIVLRNNKVHHENSKIITVNTLNFYQGVQEQSNVKIHSTDDEIQQFIFKNCVKKFITSIKYENDKINDENNFYALVSVMDLYNLMRKSQNDSVDHVQKLCNGDYNKKGKPLCFAVSYHKNIDIAQALLENGANPNIRSHESLNTPME